VKLLPRQRSCCKLGAAEQMKSVHDLSIASRDGMSVEKVLEQDG
jgi:hypothetical protein